MITYTTILHQVRCKLAISNNEYVLCDTIHKLSHKTGFFEGKREYLEDIVGLTDRALRNMITRLEKEELIQRDSVTGKLSVLPKWTSNVVESNVENRAEQTSAKGGTNFRQTAEQTSAKGGTNFRYNNNRDNNRDNNINKEREEKNLFSPNPLSLSSSNSDISVKEKNQKKEEKSCAKKEEAAISLFSESIYAQGDEGQQLFEQELINRNQDYQLLDLVEYKKVIQNWSDAGAHRRANWIAFAESWILRNKQENKLIIKPEFKTQYDTAKHIATTTSKHTAAEQLRKDAIAVAEQLYNNRPDYNNIYG